MFNQSSEIARSLCGTHECNPLYQSSLLERIVKHRTAGANASLAARKNIKRRLYNQPSKAKPSNWQVLFTY